MYIVEGNIGAGKSTLLTLISSCIPAAKVWFEPLHAWQRKEDEQSLLHLFYQDPQRWAFIFETHTLMCRVREQLAYQSGYDRLHIVERSVYSGYYCFAQNSFDQGFLTPIEWQLYQEWFSFLTALLSPPKGFIYLRVCPERSYERIKKRNRAAERGLTMQYVHQLYEKYEAFLFHQRAVATTKVPILVLNGDVEFADEQEGADQLMVPLQQFIADTL